MKIINPSYYNIYFKSEKISLDAHLLCSNSGMATNRGTSTVRNAATFAREKRRTNVFHMYLSHLRMDFSHFCSYLEILLFAHCLFNSLQLLCCKLS